MIAVIDSGSTKADWKFLSPNAYPISITTMGFNPYYHDESIILPQLESAFNGPINSADLTKIYFYGAGCSDPQRNKIIADVLQKYFTNAEIKVEHDILACALATCRDQPGISCILGTGSNSCLFDGEKIIDNVPNLAYILGDEGSGGHLGRLLIQSYFYREFPIDIKNDFEEAYGNDRQVFLDNIYIKPNANVYLASFARFLSDHKDHIYIQSLVNRSFTEFIKRHVRKYQNHTNLPIHFIGSVAYHFGDILKLVLDERSLTLGIIIKKPIDNLVDYHIELEGWKKSNI